jgi:hypothetical protein
MIDGMQEVFDSGVSRASTTLDETPSGDQIACELHRLGIRHLSWAGDTVPGSFTTTSLLVGLAASPDARLRNALVPLFILRTEYGDAVPGAAEELSERSRVHLACAYSAAVVLQESYGPHMAGAPNDDRKLEDHFADELGLPATAVADVRLAAIADRHARLSGEDLNWSGTYRHAVESCLRFVDKIAG